jgi:hypothetical protein
VPGGSLVFMDTATPQSVDRDRLWSHQRLVAVHRPRPASGSAVAGAGAMGTSDARSGLCRGDFAAGIDRTLGGRRSDRTVRAKGVAATWPGRSRLWKRPRKNRGSFSPTPPDWVNDWRTNCAPPERDCRIAGPERNLPQPGRHFRPAPRSAGGLDSAARRLRGPSTD